MCRFAFLCIAIAACTSVPPSLVPDATVEDADIDAAYGDAANEDTGDASTDPPRDAAPIDVTEDVADGRHIYAYDLDEDGTPETNLAVVPCDGDLCLQVQQAGRVDDIPLAPASTDRGSTILYGGATITLIGDHDGDGLQEVAIAHALQRIDHLSPALSVVDIATAHVDTTAAPEGLSAFAQYPLAAFHSTLRSPEGLAYPYLVPSYGDADGRPWGYGCLYRPGHTPEGPCGANFLSINTIPAGTGWFREVGAYAQDIDADGWDDLHLIFHRLIYSVSGRTGAVLATTTYDVATEEVTSPPWFHSGRNYGTHATRHMGDSIQTLIVGGSPVGNFGNLNCNVSRFIAVLSTTSGVPGSRHLAWSDYFGFASTSFHTFDPSFVGRESEAVSRLGDFAEGCIHRFGDSYAEIDGEEALIFNYFASDGPVDTCLDEQYRLYLPPVTNWMDEKSDTWYACLAQNVGSPGTWGMQARRVRDGTSVTGSQGTYVWGRVDTLFSAHPTAEPLYLVESLPRHARFDLADVPVGTLHIYALRGGLFVSRGVLPENVRPVVEAAPHDPARALGDTSSFTRLLLADRDEDGLTELLLDNGDWVGIDSEGTLVVKGP